MSGRLLLWSVLALLLAPGRCVLAQSELHIDCYGVDDGLSHSQVNDVIQDDEGYMWFATANGLSRFDGYRFHSFPAGPDRGPSHLTQAVYHLALDGGGRVWAASASTLFGYDPRTGGFDRV